MALVVGCGARTSLPTDGESGGQEGCSDQAVDPQAPSLAPDSPSRFSVVTGDDGSYRIRVPEYTTTADIVTDSVTRLVWQRHAPLESFSFQEASSYCRELSLAGFSDWRLPSRLELVTIVDYGRENPAIDAEAFAYVHDSTSLFGGCFWSSSLNGTGNRVWRVCYSAFSYTDAGSDPLDDHREGVRCVRGEVRDAAYEVTCSGEIVIDKKTGLMWQRHVEDIRDASWIPRCEALSLAGYTDWRLPSIKELQTIVDETQHDPAINPDVFPNTPSYYAWSSTFTTGAVMNRWAVEFGGEDPTRIYGRPTTHGPGGLLTGRCVR